MVYVRSGPYLLKGRYLVPRGGRRYVKMPWVHVPDMNHRMYLQVHVPTVY